MARERHRDQRRVCYLALGSFARLTFFKWLLFEKDPDRNPFSGAVFDKRAFED